MMSDFEKAKALQAIMNHYGFEKQQEQFVEECAEAIRAVQKHKRYPDSNKALNELYDEVADVVIMTTQMYNFLDEEKLEGIIERKLKRQIRRIKEEEKS